jgi:hypothetical protein
VAAIYYLSLVFPDDLGDLDGHFDARCWAGSSPHRAAGDHGRAVPGAGSLRTIVITWSFFPASLLAIGASRVVLGCLWWLLLLYPFRCIEVGSHGGERCPMSLAMLAPAQLRSPDTTMTGAP